MQSVRIHPNCVYAKSRAEIFFKNEIMTLKQLIYSPSTHDVCYHTPWFSFFLTLIYLFAAHVVEIGV